MKTLRLIPVWLTVSLLYGCNVSSEDHDIDGRGPVVVDNVFQDNWEGWEAGVTDFGVEQEELINFSAKVDALPEKVGTYSKAMILYGENRSDDIFMFLTKKVSGLAPGHTYDLKFDLELVSPYPENAIGAGGSPATDVFIKVGASDQKPERIKFNPYYGVNNDTRYYGINIDKGNQSESGSEMVVIGNMSNGKEDRSYTLIKRSSQEMFRARADAKGELWIVIGADSGHEGSQHIYLTRARVSFK